MSKIIVKIDNAVNPECPRAYGRFTLICDHSGIKGLGDITMQSYIDTKVNDESVRDEMRTAVENGDIRRLRELIEKKNGFAEILSLSNHGWYNLFVGCRNDWDTRIVGIVTCDDPKTVEEYLDRRNPDILKEELEDFNAWMNGQIYSVRLVNVEFNESTLSIEYTPLDEDEYAEFGDLIKLERYVKEKYPNHQVCNKIWEES